MRLSTIGSSTGDKRKKTERQSSEKLPFVYSSVHPSVFRGAVAAVISDSWMLSGEQPSLAVFWFVQRGADLVL